MSVCVSYICKYKLLLSSHQFTKEDEVKKIISVVVMTSSIYAGGLFNKIVYGEDNRIEISESIYGHYANSIAGQIDRGLLVNKGNYYEIRGNRRLTSYQGRRTCEDVPFREQRTMMNCTSALVAQDVVITAGHCFLNKGQVVKNKTNDVCKNTNFVFNFSHKVANQKVVRVESRDVFSCKSIISAKYDKDADYAIIKLDRKSSYSPLPFSQDDLNYYDGADISVIGHPTGLPLKYAGGAKIKAVLDGSQFKANLDTFRGNSGSPVFNDLGEIIGILVNGAPDYYYNRERGCVDLNVCSDDGESCLHNNLGISSFEGVTKLSSLPNSKNW